MTAFQLAQQLAGHEQDVRALVNSSDGHTIFSASRDRTIREWQQTTELHRFQPTRQLLGHQHFVSSLCFVPPSSTHPKGLLISGGMDKLILVWDLSSSVSTEPLYTLIEHKDTVSSLATLPSSGDTLLFASASWDKTVKVWLDKSVQHTLEGHQAAVWSVVFWSDDKVLTASADKSIKLWKSGKCIRTFLGHTDVVRDLVRLPNNGQRFASCSNDGSIRLWSIESGECLSEMFGHTSFVYSLDALPTGELVSSGEDKTVRVWRDGQCVQTIIHPAISIWTVCALPDGDLISGASDSMIRRFTRQQERLASADELLAFEDAVSKSTVHSGQIGDVDRSKIPGVEALQKPGAKDQQVIMVRNGGSVEAHQWSQATQSWTKIGDVVDAVGSGRKQVFEGREYDYVFDVDITEGAPPLKLPFNNGENPYMAAQQFIHRNELSQDYLDQIATFITRNTQSVTLSAAPPSGTGGAANQFADPFTGAGRYVPSSSAGEIGGSSYGSAAPTIVNPDPFTGPAAQSSVSVTSPQRIVPLGENGYLTFKTANLPACLKKIQELNRSAPVPLTATELKVLEKALVYLQNPAAPSVKFTPADYQLLIKLIEWPVTDRFPGLDLLRLAVADSPVPAETPVAKESGTQTVLDILSNLAELGLPEMARDANLMLGYRCLANLFATTPGRKLASLERRFVLELVDGTLSKRPMAKLNGNCRLAIVTVLLNLSIALIWVVSDAEFAMQLLTTTVRFAQSESDGENLYRALVATGNLIFKYKDLREALLLMEVKPIFQKCQSMDSRLQQIAAQLQQLSAAVVPQR